MERSSSFLGRSSSFQSCASAPRSSCGHLLQGRYGETAYSSSFLSRSQGSNVAHARRSLKGRGRYLYG
jgi:hypothetical protein